jgi:phosphoglycerol transferase MdoB-like AlkP superfamily enzyme
VPVFQKLAEPKDSEHMRLKLVFISALIAAIVGAGSAIAIILAVFSSLKPVTAPGLFVLSIYLLPMGATLLATIFVYRHTAKRRRLQAALTTIISLLLTIAIFVLASVYTARSDQIRPQPATPANVS